MSIMVAAILMLGAPQDDLLAGGAARLAVRDDDAKPRSRYRIDPGLERGSNAKDRAFAEDGQRCQLVGARMCTKRPRAVLSAPLSE